MSDLHPTHLVKEKTISYRRLEKIARKFFPDVKRVKQQ